MSLRQGLYQKPACTTDATNAFDSPACKLCNGRVCSRLGHLITHLWLLMLASQPAPVNLLLRNNILRIDPSAECKVTPSSNYSATRRQSIPNYPSSTHFSSSTPSTPMITNPTLDSQPSESSLTFTKQMPSRVDPGSIDKKPAVSSTGAPVAGATTAPKESIVIVPATIGGSRKETAYMRLSNRVRLIEANVSVSMQ
ncbi:unnamed protein product [Protopolystoma xenopodis]|uniref:Uncharacterized protein n=1 Tax=Protopolystoma xenopodis TaxID=117903 RepID=A0A3S4ZM03_9PLAT|nr:unnamed protein product [Protopolystoma xenopodis]